MELLQRNQLVWLHPQAWQKILGMAWDVQARQVLLHWSANALPLVVARQRLDVARHRICVGLPAPARWARRRLALDVDDSDVCKIGLFPALSGVLSAAGRHGVAQAVPPGSLQLRVYGSYGWQALTGMDYVHAASDLDVLLAVTTLQHAIQGAHQMGAWDAPCRVDGEVVFPCGHAVAWRELVQAHAGAVRQVLVKHRQSAVLMTLQELEQLTGAQSNVHRNMHRTMQADAHGFANGVADGSAYGDRATADCAA